MKETARYPNKRTVRKPDWLKIKLPSGDQYGEVAGILSERGLNTICVSGRCPNLAECWHHRTATFMILGNICTRNCAYCAVGHGKVSPPDPQEARKVAEAVKLMGVRHVVITSVTRDDMPDGGAAHWADTIVEVRRQCPDTVLEVLIPDFCGNEKSLGLISDARPDILGHNLETVRRMFSVVRPGADYELSLGILRYFSGAGLVTKSGIMVGLSETYAEVNQTLDDLMAAGCRMVTIGQYLQPTRHHFPVCEYVHPDIFASYAQEARKRGFTSVESAPLVRSSYMHGKKTHKQSKNS